MLQIWKHQLKRSKKKPLKSFEKKLADLETLSEEKQEEATEILETSAEKKQKEATETHKL